MLVASSWIYVNNLTSLTIKCSSLNWSIMEYVVHIAYGWFESY